ncbi:MAG: hypothetical protein IJY86_05010 [Clostridia bacterium]|nr:hypothetical protein [Clostridia bacterium]
MSWKKLCRALLHPHISVMMALVPLSGAFLVWAMVCRGTESAVAITSYVVAAYTLTVWCFRVPVLIRYFKTFKSQNRYARLWLDNRRLRVNVSLFTSLVWNLSYALLQLGLGITNRSFWFCSLAAYYFSVAVMRFFLVRYTFRHKAGENMALELKKYRACGIVLLIMNLALSLMIFFMVYWNRTFQHHEIVTIAMAAYTFTSFTKAIINVVKYSRLGSPVYSASKAVSFASACVSMLTLESTMLTTFEDGTMTLAGRQILLGVSGGVVSAVVIAMAVYMIVWGTKRLKLEKNNG